MEGAPVVILLVGMVFPIALLMLAVVANVFALIWAVYTLWRDDWSVGLGHTLQRIGRAPHWHLGHH